MTAFLELPDYLPSQRRSSGRRPSSSRRTLSSPPKRRSSAGIWSRTTRCPMATGAALSGHDRVVGPKWPDLDPRHPVILTRPTACSGASRAVSSARRSSGTGSPNAAGETLEARRPGAAASRQAQGASPGLSVVGQERGQAGLKAQLRRPGRPWAKTQGTRMVGVAPPARPAPPAEVRELARRRPGSGAAVRGSRGGPSSRTRPPPRGRQRSCITPLAKTPENRRNSAACTQSRGAVWARSRAPMGYPTPVGRRRTLGRVARAAQHRRVVDVERRTASGERDDVIDGQVGRSVGVALVARAPVAVLAAPRTQHAGAEPLPGPRGVEGVVPTAVGLPRVLGAATTSAAGDDAADRAQLHPQIVGGLGDLVYSLGVLGLRGQA